MKFEGRPKPAQPTPEQRAKIEKERTLSDAELLKGGAEYKVDERGGIELEPTREQIETAKAAAPDRKEDSFGYENIKSIIEQEIGKKLPDNPEEFVDNFEQLVPKDFSGLNLVSKDKMLRLTKREEIKSFIEKRTFGASLKEIEEEFTLPALGPDGIMQTFEEGTIGWYAKRAFNEAQARNYGPLLGEIEKSLADRRSLNDPVGLPDYTRRVVDSRGDYTHNKDIADKLERFATRLMREVYKNKPEKKFGTGDVKRVLDRNLQRARQEGETEEELAEWQQDAEKRKTAMDKGDFLPALTQIEYNINTIVSQRDDLLYGKKAEKAAMEEFFREQYGDDYRSKINQELEDLRRMRELLKNKIRETEKVSPLI